MNKKVLILGAGGMLGHDLVEAFAAADVTAWDVAELDITNQEQVFDKISRLAPDVVINAAAYTDVDGAESNETTAMRINGEAVGFIAKAAQASHALTVHFSTEYVFDGTNEQGYDEKAKVKPVNVYGHSKLAGEELLQVFTNKFYLIRTSWLYGHAPQKGKPRGMNFVDTMLKLATEKPELNIVADQFGKPTFTKDLARTVAQMIADSRPSGTYHVVNEGVTSWYEFAKEIFNVKGVYIKVNPIESKDYPLPTPRPKHSVLLNTKLPPLRPWQQALREYLS